MEKKRDMSEWVDNCASRQWSWRHQLPFLMLSLIVCASLYVAVAHLNNWYDPPFGQFSDLNIRIPKALQQLDPRLYPDSPAVRPGGRDELVHRELFILLLSSSIRAFGGFRLPLIAMSILLTLVFVTGVYVLTWALGGDRLAAAIAAVLAAGNFQAWGGVGLGFAPRQVLPRNFVVALSPYLLASLLRWQRSRRLWVVFVVVGVVANLHLMAAFHLCLIFLGTLLLTSDSLRAGLRQVFVCGVVALLFASPAVWPFLPLARGSVAVSEGTAARLGERHSFEVSVSWDQVQQLAVAFIPYAAIGAGGLFHMLRSYPQWRRDRLTVYTRAALVACVLPLLGLVINQATLSLRILSLLRVSRYYFLFCFAPAGLLLSGWMRRRSRVLTVLASLCLVVLLLLGVPGVTHLLVRGSGDQAGSSAMVWDWESFSDMCNWVSANTSFDALFLTPTDWALFRVYAQRRMVADWKGGFNELYYPVTELYRAPAAETFRRLTADSGADYVVASADLDIPGWAVVYANDAYRVLAVP